MDFIDHAKNCNNFKSDSHVRLIAEGQTVGYLKKSHARIVSLFPGFFHRLSTEGDLTFHPKFNTYQGRSLAVASILPALQNLGVIEKIRGEKLYVAPEFGQTPLLEMDRGAAEAFGIAMGGAFLNGYVQTAEDPKIWVGTRGPGRVFAGKKDSLVGGGIAKDEQVLDTLLAECYEEADLAADIVRKNARYIGSVQYRMEKPQGLLSVVLYIYDMDLPEDFQPKATDGSVEKFELLSVEELKTRLKQQDIFKPDVPLELMASLIARGYITEKDCDISALTKSLNFVPAAQPPKLYQQAISDRSKDFGR